LFVSLFVCLFDYIRFVLFFIFVWNARYDDVSLDVPDEGPVLHLLPQHVTLANLIEIVDLLDKTTVAATPSSRTAFDWSEVRHT
jgi:hypothetical protein